MSDKTKAVIFGLGDFARVAAVYLESDAGYEVVAFTANEGYVRRPALNGKPIVAFERLEEVYPPETYSLFVAVGFKNINRERARICGIGRDKGYKLISYVSSSSLRAGGTSLGDNCFILENTVIQPFVKIGDDVVIWGGGFIAHDSTIGDHCFIAPSVAISGNVTIGSFSFIGINATVRDGITIAPGCIIGAGVTVLEDTLPNHVYAGQGAGVPIISSRMPVGF